jgi:CheY-like chemotaxis protein/two-component sensor histidine kinase
MIEDLLDFSRIVAGSLRLRVEHVSLSELIQNVVDSVGPPAEAKGVTIEADVQPPALRVEGDSMRLQQVLHNLVFNALKFTPQGGRISISAGTDGNTATIRVTDTGSGIAAEFLPHIFESFRQAETRPARRQGGLGLGLAIVKHLVELHGGHIEASSAGLNRGSTFNVNIPVSNRVRQAFQEGLSDAMEGDQSKDALKGLRILVVEDEAVILRMLKAFLERQGAEVRPSANAGEAIKELEEWIPDVLLSDIGMPDEDGLELISRVRVMDSESVRNVLAIALTGRTREDDRLKALAAGYQMFVPKSVKPADLVETIATLVKNRG